MVMPTVILPGYLAGAAPYQGMAQMLTQLGYPTWLVPLRRRSWLPTIGGRSVSPILAQLDATVQTVLKETGETRINLVGHSAGGWIARIYLGETPYSIHSADRDRPKLWRGHLQTATLITLGTPHVSQERWTRRNLDFVNSAYPGAFHENIRYVCVAGKAAYGERSWQGWFTYNSYLLTAGKGNCWGDGITPIAAAHLEGADNQILEGVYHSPGASRTWYGSSEIVEVWARYLV